MDLKTFSDNCVEQNLFDEEGNPIEDRYDHRDLSWLKFNLRVFLQSSRQDFTEAERFKFVQIAISNLNEFISVRLADALEKNESKSIIKKMLADISYQKELINDALMKKIDKMVKTYPYKDLGGKWSSMIKCIIPISLGSNKEIPIFKEDELNYFIKLSDNNNENITYCFLQIPSKLKRIPFYDKKSEEAYCQTFDNIIDNYLDFLFENKEVQSKVAFKVIKKHNEEVKSDPSVPIVNRITEVINNQEQNQIIGIDVQVEPPGDKILKKLRKVLGVKSDLVFCMSNSLAVATDYLSNKSNHINDVFKIDKKEGEKFVPVVKDIDADTIMEYLDNHDLLLHHPFDSFQTVIDFLNEAANDPKVISIRQTLYRVSSVKSPVIKALCDAARNGKKVVVMLELLARFDEKQNVRLINTLKQAGCAVVYSIEGLKTHAKMCLVARRHNSDEPIRIYAHTGTGNYNEKTACQYTDFSYFTSDEEITKHLVSVFNMITGFSNPNFGPLDAVSYSPVTLRGTLAQLFSDATYAATNNLDVTINIKVNSISDPAAVAMIYAAANAGAKVNIICRGICSLVPYQENVTVKSVVGRFLEHSRMYQFICKSKTDVEVMWHRTYIASADLLTRNLDRRIEIFVMIKNDEIIKQLSDIFALYMKDTENSSKLNGPKDYYFVEANEDDKFDVHQYLIEQVKNA